MGPSTVPRNATSGGSPVTPQAAGWSIVLLVLGAAQAAVGVGLFLDGGFLPGAIFDGARAVPWWAWAGWALASGVLVLGRRWSRRVAITGLVSAAAWYCAWSALLSVGILDVGGPYYAIAVYVGLAALHVLAALVEIMARTETRARL